MNLYIGIDLGGTKIAGVVLNEQGEVIHQHRMKTPVELGYLAILSDIAQMVEHLETQVGQPCSIGLGTPGTLDTHSHLLKNSNITALNGKPFAYDLSTQLKRPIRMANDANCFTLSEATDGAAQGGQVVFGVIIGTGVGGGIVMNRQIYEGVNGIAGEWGHVVLMGQQEGWLCYCGKRGCVETMLSGPGFMRDYLAHGGKLAQSTAEIVQLAREHKEKAAEAALARYCENFGRALAMVVNILDPDKIVLGGGMSNILEIYDSGIMALSRYVFSQDMHNKVVQNRFGDDSGVRGAAWLWKEDFKFKYEQQPPK
jgi:fructokinase